MRNIISATAFLLLLACDSPSKQYEAGTESKSAKAESAAANGTAGLPRSAFYLHCIGRDVHLRKYQPSILLSYLIDEARPNELKQLNEVSREYYSLCFTNGAKCEITITPKEIIASAENHLTDIATQSQYLRVDRISGEFREDAYFKVSGKEATEHVAVGNCTRSTSAIPDISI